MTKKNTLGITVKKDKDFSEWYTQIIQKADLADYSSVSGCIVYKPNSYSIWEKIKEITDKKFKAVGIKNAYFPLFIPESLLQKEAKHIEGFAPEVAWVTHAGSSKLNERLAVRPTSETIMYDSYSKWIRSYNDLPLRINQWNNVVRWEFKHPTPFLRGREFLWNEGHTCFATKEEAEAEGKEIIDIYDDVCKNYLAMPSLIGKKSEKEKFAGAVYTISMEFIMPNSKSIQGPDFHHDGQNFSKPFEISYTDKEGNKQYVWQNTWAISTRMLGVLIAMHSDDKGLILPPKVASTQAVIIPIFFSDTKAKITKEAQKIKDRLQKTGISVHFDDREGYSPGWKFNEWEIKGIPVRIELGPRDLEKNEVVIVRRDTNEKQTLPLSALAKEVELILGQIQDNLYGRAEELLKKSVIQVDNLKEAKEQLNLQKIIFSPWCGDTGCEDKFKEMTGAKSLNSPLEQPKLKKDQKCFACKEKAKYWFYLGKSY
ncbi:MAG: proline--tRNA ligase [Nanoarchaeota archaeon]|nr:proline--tRNA ligase [Nanoarchaeota archaeon]MBU1632609.1 proline--tRNA ligase [Nanoarchaeota archaeon]MBU1876369.1 proline--tRNA ligase [Nanoarchaeota archaeon]